MRSPAMLEYPIKEYKNRIKKIVSQMEEHNIETLILTAKENVYYFSGFKNIVWDSKVATPGVIIITDDGEVTLVGSHSAVPSMKISACIEDIRAWDPLGRYGLIDDYAEAIYNVLKEKQKHKGKIGLELGEGVKIHLSYKHFSNLKKLLKDATIVDASEALWEVRAVKSELEIQEMRKVCKINVNSFEKGFETLYEGMTEQDLFRNIATEMFRLGAQGIIPLGIRAGADRYSQGNSPASKRPIRKGEIVLVDGGPSFKGYYSDIIREAVIGKPTDQQKELYDFAVEACEIGLEKIKPGVLIKDVCMSINDFFEKSKFNDLNASSNWYGHSIGLDIHELPVISINTNKILKPGMVFAIEPYVYKEGVGSLGIEENIVVTNDGYELLSPMSRELHVIN